MVCNVLSRLRVPPALTSLFGNRYFSGHLSRIQIPRIEGLCLLVRQTLLRPDACGFPEDAKSMTLSFSANDKQALLRDMRSSGSER
jgi:hypothetical protein